MAKKILLRQRAVKGKIASPRCPYSLGKIDDFHLNYGIPKENPKNNISGSYT